MESSVSEMIPGLLLGSEMRSVAASRDEPRPAVAGSSHRGPRKSQVFQHVRFKAPPPGPVDGGVLAASLRLDYELKMKFKSANQTSLRGAVRLRPALMNALKRPQQTRRRNKFSRSGQTNRSRSD